MPLTIELSGLLAFSDHRAVTGTGKECRDAGATGAKVLGQRALRSEFQFQLAIEILALELLVFAYIRGDHLLDLTCLQQRVKPEPVDAGVVRDEGQIFLANQR